MFIFSGPCLVLSMDVRFCHYTEPQVLTVELRYKLGTKLAGDLFITQTKMFVSFDLESCYSVHVSSFGDICIDG